MTRRAATPGGTRPVPDDRTLATLAAAGDRAAFESIYRAHADRTFALLTRLVGPDREREDLLQETFVRLHGALPRYRGDASLITFIYQITTHVALDHLRRRRPLDELDLDGELDPSATPADQAQRREELARALAMLEKLSPKHRVAFVLREVLGYSHEEVAVLVGSFAATARMRVNAAKRKLAALAAREEQR
ncbi:MAG: RNA polymerase sigma factor [Kofleriaceae bacterium]